MVKKYPLCNFIVNFILFIFVGQLSAQHEPIQPFEELGIKVKVLTLSNGKYQESFPNDTIHRIGSVMFNRVTGEVESVVLNDTLHGEYNLKPDVVSRWLSPDPLVEERNWLSPYNYVQNNPIIRIDPDGALDSPIFDKDGNFLATDSEGFKGDIIIMEKSFFNKLTNNGENTLAHSTVESMLDSKISFYAQTLDNYVANDYNGNSRDDSKVLSNIFTNLVSEANKEGLVDYDISNLSQNKINIVNDFEYPNGAAANSTRFSKKDRISVLVKPMSLNSFLKDGPRAKRDVQSLWYLGNAANAIHILGVHEPLHRKFPSRTKKAHKDMYNYIMNNKELRKSLKNVTPSLKKLTKKFQKG